MAGGVSQRALRSRFASDLPISVINEITERRKNRRYSNFSVFQAKNSFSGGASTSYPSCGGRKGTTASFSSSSSFLTRNLKFGDTSYLNYSIVGNDSLNHFNYGVKNWSVGSTSKSNTLPKNVMFAPINNNPFRVQTEVGIGSTNKGGFDKATANSSGFNFTGQNKNRNVRSCLNERFVLVHEGFGLVHGPNVSETRGNHLHKLKAIVETHEHHNNVNSLNKADFNPMAFNISDSLVADGMNLHNEVCKQ